MLNLPTLQLVLCKYDDLQFSFKYYNDLGTVLQTTAVKSNQQKLETNFNSVLKRHEFAGLKMIAGLTSDPDQSQIFVRQDSGACLAKGSYQQQYHNVLHIGEVW